MTTAQLCFAAFRPSIDLARAKGGDTVHGLPGIDLQTITVAKLQTHGNKGGAEGRKQSRNGDYDDEDAAEGGARTLACLETSRSSGCLPESI